MRLRILCDVNWESKVDAVANRLQKAGCETAFEGRDYGPSIHRIVIDLVCRNPDLKHKRRRRLANAEKTLYFDIMLKLEEMVDIDSVSVKSEIIIGKIKESLIEMAGLYEGADFNWSDFLHDFDCWGTAAAKIG